jgi:hypothetical protein
LGGIDWNIWTSDNKLKKKISGVTARLFFICQHVDRWTRARSNDEQSILDLVLGSAGLINDIDYYSSLGKSDHSVLLVSINESKNAKIPENRLNYDI